MPTNAQRIAALETQVASLLQTGDALKVKDAEHDARLKKLETPVPAPAPPTGGLTDLPGWKLVFADEFDRTVAAGHFLDGSLGRRTVGDVTADGKYGVAYWQDTYRKGTYSGAGVSIEGGRLRTLIGTFNGVPRVVDLKPITSVSDPNTGGITGPFRIQYRVRADRMLGYKVVNLLWATLASGGGMGDYRTYGEIDFPERESDRQPYAYMHRRNGADSNDQDYYPTPGGTTFQDWHDYAIEFYPDVSCQFFLDGVSIGKSTSRVPGGSPFRPVIRCETNLNTTMPDPAVQGYFELERLGIWVPA